MLERTAVDPVACARRYSRCSEHRLRTPLGQARRPWYGTYPILLLMLGSVNSIAAITRKTRCILFVWVLVAACGGNGAPTESAITRTISGSVGVFAFSADRLSTISAITEAELLLDGKRVGPRLISQSGSDRVFLQLEEAISGGPHTVAVRIVAQRYAAVEYLIVGGFAAANRSTGVIVTAAFPDQFHTMRAGDKVELTINVP